MQSGASLNALNLSQWPPGKEFCCDTTGGGFNMASWYMVNNSRSRLFCTDGPIYDVWADAMLKALIVEEVHPRKVFFEQNIAGTGTITDDDTDGGISLSTGATSGGSARINLNGSRADLAKPAMMRFKMELTDADNCLVRIGLGMTPVTTDNHANQNAIGMEIDSSDNVDDFWGLRSGSGIQTSPMVTENYPLTSANTYRYIIMWIPNDGIYMWANGILVAYKDYDLPTGKISTSRWFSAGIKNRENNTKTLNLRSLHIYALNGDDY
jgi:hypothetical protein